MRYMSTYVRCACVCIRAHVGRWGGLMGIHIRVSDETVE